MAALIDTSNGRNNIAYVGKEPWHGLGTKLNPKTPYDIWLKEAGFLWTAEKAPILFRDKDGVEHYGDNQILYRSDTKAQLGVCSDRYKIVQPEEVMGFYRDLVGVHGWDIEVAGCLDGGKRLWALAKTGDNFGVNGTIDTVETYLLLATSFDGSMATIGKFTSVRVVCQNTLTMSLGDGIAQVAIPHSRQFNSDEMKLKLGIHTAATAKLKEEAAEMAKYKLKDSEAMKFIIRVLEGKDKDPESMSTRGCNIATNVFNLFRGNGMGATLQSADGTLWGAVNAVTEYLDHHINTRSDNNRVKSAWFGAGDEKKVFAYNEALKLVA